MVYKGCENCKYEKCGEKDFPCCDCKNNFVIGTPGYEHSILLWELNPSYPATTIIEDVPDVPDASPVLFSVKEPVNNPVTHPSHYTQGNIQCIDAMISAFGKDAVATWCKLNAFKYTWREEHKNGLEDIEKATWYLNKFKELKSVG